MKKVTKYVANDGTEFLVEKDCLNHEANVKAIAKSRFSEYLKTYNGQKLLEKHSLDEVAVWKVVGEDPNCDMGGYHHQPLLGYYNDKLENIIKKAVLMPGFWSWGGGGDFVKINIE